MKTMKPTTLADVAGIESPYLSARREWNERYGDYIARARNWRWAAFAALGISLVLAIGVVWEAAQSKVVPYVVEVTNSATPFRLHAPIALLRPTYAS